MKGDLKPPGTANVDAAKQQQRKQVRGSNTHSRVSWFNVGTARCGNCDQGLILEKTVLLDM